MIVKEYKAVNRKINFLILAKHLCFNILVSFYEYFVVLLHIVLTKKKDYKYDVSICLIFKNEAKYLKEWIEYHILIGVDHFYLYNNLSDDNFEEVIQPYIESGVVTYIDYPHKYAQIEVYNNCYNRFKKESHWIGFIDTDEFINMKHDNDIKVLLSKYGNWPSVYINWHMFGTSGFIKENDKSLVIESFTSCWPCLCNVGKSFINNDYDFSFIHVHWHIANYLGFTTVH